ncbi:MAG: hypothetical protein M1820_008881 [Bogoriella megaspora]|nr:MAG: hypothetical protein M1820_008881 [Bogoriella megaspora]
MPSPFPSIQSFYEPSSDPPSPPKRSSPPPPPGDGFHDEDIESVLHPKADETWAPAVDYKESNIESLAAGPGCVTFQGRIVNLYDQPTPSKKPRAARGCLKIIVVDGTGSVTVRLWYANMEYGLRIGQLVSVWTPHVSWGSNSSLSGNASGLFISVFPERDRSCHFMVHENSDDSTVCKAPVGYKKGQPLPGLMTLKNFIDGGYDVDDGKLLTCVKSIGPKKTGMEILGDLVSGQRLKLTLIVTSKNGTTNSLVNVITFDDTSEATLTLWNATTVSAAHWKPSSTILLISKPGWKIDHRARLSLTASTQIEVDPNMTDADWLRKFAQRITRRQSVGSVIDETGCIASGKLIFSDFAWEQLLGRTAQQLVDSNAELLKYLEQRMLFLRVTLVFGWAAEVEKLAICQVLT